MGPSKRSICMACLGLNLVGVGACQAGARLNEPASRSVVVAIWTAPIFARESFHREAGLNLVLAAIRSDARRNDDPVVGKNGNVLPPRKTVKSPKKPSRAVYRTTRVRPQFGSGHDMRRRPLLPVKPPPTVLQSALRWLEAEKAQLADCTEALSPLQRPDLQRMLKPRLPPAPESPHREVTRYYVRVQLRNADGQVLNQKQFPRDLADWDNKPPGAGQWSPIPKDHGWDLEFGTSRPRSLTLVLKDTKHWAYADSPAAVRKFSLDWAGATTVDEGELTEEPEPGPATPMTLQPRGYNDITLNQPSAPAEARVPATAPGTGLPSALSTSASRQVWEALGWLEVAQEAIDDGVTDQELLQDQPPALYPSGQDEVRYILAFYFERARRAADKSEEALNAAKAAITRNATYCAGIGSRDPAFTKQVQAHQRRVLELVASLACRVAQYRAEALWWQAQVVKPTHPDRKEAQDVLQAALKEPDRTAADKDEIGKQLHRYEELAAEETVLAKQLVTEISAGRYDRRLIRTAQKGKTLLLTISLRQLPND